MGDYDDWEGARPFFLVLDPGDNTGPKRLRAQNGSIAVLPLESSLVQLASGQQNVSTLTPVLNFANYSLYKALVFEGWTDSANEINFVVERSPDAVHADVAQSIVVITSGKAGNVEVPLNMSQYWRLSALTDSPTFPVSVLSWRLSGLLRQL